jgi:hypothetical protein
MEEENKLQQIGSYVGEIIAVIDLIEEKGTRPDLMNSLFTMNKELKKLVEVV